MFSGNSIYPLPRDGALSAHINGDHDHVGPHVWAPNGLNVREVYEAYN